MPTRSTVLHKHEHQQDKNETDWLKQLSIDYLIEELTHALFQITGWWSRTEDRREQRIIRWRANPFFITDYRLMITYRREQCIIRLHKETLTHAFNCNERIKQQSHMSRQLDRLLAQEQYNQKDQQGVWPCNTIDSIHEKESRTYAWLEHPYLCTENQARYKWENFSRLKRQYR